MKILVISDTHGHWEGARQVLAQVGSIDALIHCGDLCGDESRIRSAVSCPCYMVAGNNDYFTDLKKDLMLEFEGHRLLVVHGHRQRVSYGMENLYFRAREDQAGVVLFGHTHQPFLEWQGGILFANPGSLTYPRQLGHEKTYLLLELAEGRLPEAKMGVLH